MNTSARRPSHLVRGALAACCGLILAVPTIAGAQSRFTGIVVFGTSLSDSGNAFVLFGDQGTPPDFTLNPLLIPSAPYAKGGHHFSNGATWIEQFARSVELGDSVRPALASSDPAVTNFAVGAARAYNDASTFNLTRQVDTFLARTGNVAPSQALYVIEMGGNDVRDAFAVYVSGGNGGPILSQALAAIAANIQRLYTAGAREFLVWTAPNVALTPAIRSLGPAAGGLATQLSQIFNAQLTQIVGQLATSLPGSRFSRLDAYRMITEIIATPGAFSLAVTDLPCVTPNVAPFTCRNADEYLFWDGIHPTKAGHALLAREAALILR